MRLARNLLLAALTALAAMALMATSASAQSIEVLEEHLAGNAHCGDVVEEAGHDVSGGCEVHATSEVDSRTFTHAPGGGEAVTSICENEFIANISEDGTGYIDIDVNTIHEDPDTGCILEPCDEAETGTTPHAYLEWPIIGVGEVGASTEALIVTFCVRHHALQPEGSGSPCTVVVDIAQDGHAQEFFTDDDVQMDNDVPCAENPATELSGHWVTDDTHDNIELAHIHYPGDNP